MANDYNSFLEFLLMTEGNGTTKSNIISNFCMKTVVVLYVINFARQVQFSLVCKCCLAIRQQMCLLRISCTAAS